MKKITPDIVYLGVYDRTIDLFEGQYRVDNGITYNSYAIIDDKIAVMDTVDVRFSHEWLDNIETALGSRQPDYLVVQHMEPDHSANISRFLEVYPKATVVASAKAFTMMKNFFGEDFADRRLAKRVKKKPVKAVETAVIKEKNEVDSDAEKQKFFCFSASVL